MRTAVGVVLLSGLLASLAEGYSISRPQERQYFSKGGVFQWSKSDENNSKDNDKSFIADESTEEGDLWASDDDPDWTPSLSQEDESYDDQDDYTEEDYNYDDEDYYTEEDYNYDDDQDDYTEEDYSHDDQDDYTEEDSSHDDQDDYTEEDYSQNDTHQNDHDQDTHPFPEISVPIAEFQQGGGSRMQHDDWSGPEQLTVNEITKNKRDVQQSRYQTQGQVVQVPAAYQTGQVVQVPPAYQTGQVVQVPAVYDTDRDRATLISGNVEPLLPVNGPQQHEVAVGVEPELDDKYEESDGGGSSIGRWWKRFRGNVEHTVGNIGDKLEEKFDKLHQTFHGLKEKTAQIVQRFKVLMKKFGLVIQEGIHYCLRRFEHSRDQVQEMQVIEKLEKKLEEGHAEVAKFFQILGEKIKIWQVQHTSENIDTGLIEGYTQEGQNQQRVTQQHQEMPDFFQDPQLLVHLDKLRDEGLLTQNDIIILTEDHDIQDQQHQHEHQQQNQNHDFQQHTQQNYNQQQTPFKPDFIRFPESE